MRIAAVQCSPHADEVRATCDAVAARLRWADAAGVELVLFPEAYLLGHSYDGATIERRAREVSGGALAELCGHVAGFRATAVVGAFAWIGARAYNSAFVIARGAVIGRYAKAHPNEPVVAAGTDFPIFEAGGVAYGINICNDANHPEAAQRIADQGAKLLLYPLDNMLQAETAERWRERSVANLVARARQTGCWVASADVTGREGERISFGCTAIVAPDGAIVARVDELREGVAVYDLPISAYPALTA